MKERERGGGHTMEVEGAGSSGRGTSSVLLERQNGCDTGVDVESCNHRDNDNCQNMIVQFQNRPRSYNHSHPHHYPHHHGSAGRNIEIDWREVDPYFSELSDCASFWTLINFTCDVIYSGLFVLFFIMGQDVESMFFEGLLNHINPILIYLILSLIINYGALRSLRCGKERCFLVFSIMKSLLFPITLTLLVYLVFFDVQDYFGTFWVSFVAIVSCYNGTAALGLWSMFTCNKYILINEAAQKRVRKLARQEQPANYEPDCRCAAAPQVVAQTSASYCESNQISSSSSRPKPTSSSSHSRKIGDSSCANNLILVCKPDVANNYNNQGFRSRCQTSRLPHAKDKRTNNVLHSGRGGGVSSSIVNIEDNDDDDEYDDILSFGDDDDDDDEDEVLQISTVHKVMQEIRLLDAKRGNRDILDSSDDDGDSL